jgi:ubiquinone/menaquinone biosynthesis C-methylase UbiE
MFPIREESKKYWDEHPIGVEVIGGVPRSIEAYQTYLDYYDEFYDYKHSIFEYERYVGKDVLEIGCGLGIDTIKFARIGSKVTAIDLSSTAVKSTRKLLEHYCLEADIRQMSAEHLDFLDQSFDVVYAYGVVMHVADVTATMDEIYRVLRPGGEALVVLYHRWSWYWALVKLSGTKVESEEGDPPIVRVFSKRQAQKLFGRFSSSKIYSDRLPRTTLRRKGVLAHCYNYVFVPICRFIPRAVMKLVGWHLIIKAVK